VNAARKNRPRRLWWAPPILAAACVLGAVLCVDNLDWLGHRELQTHQWWLLHTPFTPDARIAVISIEAETPDKLGAFNASLPLARHYHAELLKGLRGAGARSVLIDLKFLQPSVPAEDRALTDALAAVAPMPVTLATEELEKPPPQRDPEAQAGFRYRFAPVALKPLPASVTVASAKVFDPGNQLDGAVLVGYDYRTERPIPHAVLCAVLGYFGLSPSGAAWDREASEVRAGDHRWNVGPDAELHARWTRLPNAFQRREYSEALHMLRGPERAFFRDKLVIVGDYSGEDQHPTPLGRMPGPEFNAHLVNTLLARDNPVFAWPTPVNALWAGLLCLGVILAVRAGNPTFAVGSTVAALSAATLAPGLAYVSGHYWLDTIWPFLGVCFALALSALWETVRSGRLVQRFMPLHIREGRTESQTEWATVMFVDLKGSTAISAALGPDRARDLLSDLLKRLSAVVTAYQGAVERTLGDGLLAIFRELPPLHHATRAVESVAELQAAVQGFSEECRERFGVEVGVTIGIETGMVSGTVIRHAQWEEWSSFGPTVNLAARIQGACGILGKSVLLGPGCREQVHHRFETEEVARVELKGVQEPTPVFTLAITRDA
jgi:class 3 adenylate cyclase/CHASE2 domain-containing sensor protein